MGHPSFLFFLPKTKEEERSKLKEVIQNFEYLN